MPTRHARTPAPAKPEVAAAHPTAAPGAPTAQPVEIGDVLLQLQRQHGNRYVQRLVRRAGAATSPARAPVVQTKMQLGPAVDRYEREADRIAAAVAGRAPSHRPAAGIEQLHGAAGGTVDAPVAAALHRARGGGQPLPAAVRSSMERALGADF